MAQNKTNSPPQFDDATYEKLGLDPGNKDIIEAVKALQSSYKMNGVVEHGKTIITYSFAADPTPAKDAATDAITPASESQRTLIRAAMKEYSSVANFEFREAAIPEEANIKIFGADFNDKTVSPGTGKLFAPGGDAGLPRDGKNSILRLNNQSTADPSLSSDGYFIALHELGHALGLKHSFEKIPENNLTVPPKMDRLGYTVMAYDDNADKPLDGAYTDRADGIAPKTLMPMDIAAIQALYGANRDNTGDTVDRISGGAMQDGPRTIYHGPAGLHTLDLSSIRKSSEVFLGLDHVSMMGIENVNFAYGTRIDKVIGGDRGLNLVEGSKGHTIIVGGAGSNFINGNNNDTIIAGPGENDISIGTGKNLVQENGGTGSLKFGMGGDDIVRHFNSEKDTVSIATADIDRAERYEVGGKQVLFFTSKDGQKLKVTLEQPGGPPVTLVIAGNGNETITVKDMGTVTTAQMHAIELGAHIKNSYKAGSSEGSGTPPILRQKAASLPDR